MLGDRTGKVTKRGATLGVLALLVLALIGWALFADPADRRAAGPDDAGGGPAAVEATPGAALRAARDGDGERRAAPSVDVVAGAGDDGAPAPPTTDAAVAFEVRCVDTRGRPVAGLEFTLDDGSSAETDETGRAVLDFDPLDRPPALADGWLLLLRGRPAEPADATAAILVVAPSVNTAGSVVGVDGAPIAGATVRLDADRAFRDLPLVLDDIRGALEGQTLEVGLDGSYRGASLPGAHGYDLVADADGFQGARVPVPTRDAQEVDFVLERDVPTAGGEARTAVTVVGTVLDAAGAPVDGAVLRWGGMGYGPANRTDADGAFALTLDAPPDAAAVLGVTADEHGLLVVRDFGALVLERWPEAPAPLVLRFDAVQLAIRGRLSDVDGEPLDGWTVEPLAGTVIASGFLSNDSQLEGHVSDVTDRDGSFDLVALDDRAYTLVAYRGRSGKVDRLEDVRPSPVPLEWVVPADAVTPLLRGVVVTTDGAPLAGARVSINVPTTELVSGAGTLVNSIGASSATTDEDGRFTLEDVPRRYASLGVSAPPGLRVEPVQIQVTEIDPAEELRIEVPFLRPVAIEVAGATRADGSERLVAIEFRDAWGERLTLSHFGENSSTGTDTLGWYYRRWGHVWVSERAVEAVLIDFETDDHDVVDRTPVAFNTPGGARVALTAP